jgi:hypothetical protein
MSSSTQPEMISVPTASVAVLGPLALGRLDGTLAYAVDQRAWFKLVRTSGAAAVVGIIVPATGGGNWIGFFAASATILVDPVLGDDAAGIGQRGTTYPFRTITAALAVAIAGDTIILRPGTYTENVVMPDIDNLSISGTGDPGATVIVQPLAGGHTIAWLPGAATGPGVHRFILRNLTVRNTSAGFNAIHIDGLAVFAPATFMDVAMRLVDVVVTKTLAGNGIFLRCMGNFFMDECVVNALPVTGATNTLIGHNCTFIVPRTSTLIGNASLEYQFTAGPLTTPGSGRSIYAFVDGTFLGDPLGTAAGTLTLLGHPIFFLDRNSSILGVGVVAGDTGGVNATALTSFGLGPVYAPVIALSGTIGSLVFASGVRIIFPAANIAAIPVFDGEYGIFFGNVQVSKTAAGASLAVAREANFRSAVVAAGVHAGPNLDLDIRGSSFVQAALVVTAPGTIDRSIHTFIGKATPGAGLTAIEFTPTGVPGPGNVPFPSASYQVSATPNGAVTKACAVTAKLGTGFSLAKSAAGGTWDILVSRSI